MLLKEQKLATAFGILSLELIKPLKMELMLPGCVTDDFQAGLRNLLKDYIKSARYYEDYQSSNYKIYQWIVSEYNLQVWQRLSYWIDYIFLHSGEDRQLEQVWILILAKGCADNEAINSISAKLFKKIKSVQMVIIEERSQVQYKIATIKSSFLHNWDASLLPLIYYENIEFLYDALLLISTCNLLVKLWEKEGSYLFEDLLIIHNWGKVVGSQMGIRKIDVPFPGIWKLSSIQRT